MRRRRPTALQKNNHRRAFHGNRSRAPPELIDRSRAREAFGIAAFRSGGNERADFEAQPPDSEVSWARAREPPAERRIRPKAAGH
jgi:hypothetical protein